MGMPPFSFTRCHGKAFSDRVRVTRDVDVALYTIGFSEFATQEIARQLELPVEFTSETRRCQNPSDPRADFDIISVLSRVSVADHHGCRNVGSRGCPLSVLHDRNS